MEANDNNRNNTTKQFAAILRDPYPTDTLLFLLFVIHYIVPIFATPKMSSPLT